MDSTAAPSTATPPTGGVDRRAFLGLCAAGLAGLSLPAVAAEAERRQLNLIWIMADDAGPAFGCYGQPQIHTPNVDRLAAEGRRYTRCYSTAPVCSPSRSAMFTGRYQTTIQSHQHRTSHPVPLPNGVKTLSDHFRAAGYFTLTLCAQPPKTSEGDQRAGAKGSGKTDYNFQVDQPYDGNDWNQRGSGQPFFAHVQLSAPHRGEAWERAKSLPDHYDRSQIKLPPYCPDEPSVVEDYINYLKAIEVFDQDVGGVLKRIEADGLLDSSIIVLGSDHGECLFRSKQFLYDGGIHVPLIIRWPDKRHAGETDHQLISSIDISATVLQLTGLPADPGMHGRSFYEPSTPKRDHVVVARDRMGLGSDRSRGIRTGRYKYIRNYLPGIPYMQINPYKDLFYPPWVLVKKLGKEGKLSPTAALFAADHKPFEELYDLDSDPHEVKNLARDPAYVKALRDLRGKLERWLATYPDQGVVMEDSLDVLLNNVAMAKVADVTPLA